MKAEELLDEAEPLHERVGPHLRDVADWFHEREGEMFTRSEVAETISDEFGIEQDLAMDVVRNLVSDIVDPIIQVTIRGEKHIGIVDFKEFDGAYGYVDYHDTIGSRKRVVCAQCVHEATYDTEVATATGGEGTFESEPNAEYDHLSDAIRGHYEKEHDVDPESVETGASLVSGTTIGGNTAWHAGNDGPGSALDADTVDGKESSDLGSKPGFIDRTTSFDGSEATITTSATRVQSGTVDLFAYESGNTGDISPNSTVTVSWTWDGEIEETRTYWTDDYAWFDMGDFTVNGNVLDSNVQMNTWNTYDTSSYSPPLTFEQPITNTSNDNSYPVPWEAEGDPLSGKIFAEWDYPGAVDDWDVVLFYGNPDGGNIQAYIEQYDGSSWNTVDGPLDDGDNISADNSKNIRVAVELSRPTLTEDPTLDAMYRRYLI